MRSAAEPSISRRGVGKGGINMEQQRRPHIVLYPESKEAATSGTETKKRTPSVHLTALIHYLTPPSFPSPLSPPSRPFPLLLSPSSPSSLSSPSSTESSPHHQHHPH
uniref:Uncharacterized protein n=1 Tax=Knipowitschia caucasica TaxID=637954 RepID=A0AAV2L9X7_KNICA